MSSSHVASHVSLSRLSELPPKRASLVPNARLAQGGRVWELEEEEGVMINEKIRG